MTDRGETGDKEKDPGKHKGTLGNRDQRPERVLVTSSTVGAFQ